jgi:hypothetical protein
MGKADDIMHDATGTLLSENGDLKVGDATALHQKRLIRCGKGENKMAPGTGVDIEAWLLDEAGDEDLKKNIATEYEKDGMTISKLQVNNGEITVSATYGK